ncbi:HdeD family acid-resistance protein [Tropicimonas sp. IMCC34043]|uniref:HdeD family acid-resistance protein n=1 Tax=Tropicimonas sp. IMCC34043 TaxID=2248760 RepID=UPI000E2535F4|nr:DUF308 domain-containing protein [Tropicimonas sp. IMCC34043]
MTEWTRWMGLGVLSIVFGILAMTEAVAVSVAITWVTGTLLVLAGLFQTILGAGDRGPANKFFSVMLGLLMIVLGVSFIRNPFQGMLSLTVVLTAAIAVAGTLRLFWAFRMRQTHYFWMMLISGALSLLLAGYIFANLAAVSTQILGILLGVELILNGLALSVLALFLRAHSSDG